MADVLLVKRNLAHDLLDEFKEWAVAQDKAESRSTIHVTWLGETARHAKVNTANERVLDEIIIYYTKLIDDALMKKLSQNNS